ncbi:MAG: hypothetical protein LBU97_04280 [Alistipes sp.]|jgi:hypothetical protein|nr:hypothetical protein [Alistipes sp.]
MRTNRFLLAALAAVTLFASCSKEGGASDAEKGQVVIRIPGVKTSPDTRAVGDPALTAAGTIQLLDGHIFVIDAAGAVIHEEPLIVSAASTDPGQKLSEQVPADSRVYVLGNIPEDDRATLIAQTTFNGIKTASSLMATQTAYKTAALANSTGLPSNITLRTAATADDPAIYEAKVHIKPLISRLEIVALQGGVDAAGGRITGFDVTGVFLDSYFSHFTYDGFGSGSQHLQGTEETFTGIGDSDTWSAAINGTGVWIASPDNTLTSPVKEAWVYNVAPSPVLTSVVPRVIIRLENIKHTPSGGVQADVPGTHYLTIYGYDGVDAFERGKIYRIGVMGDNDLIFNLDHLGETPNASTVELYVRVYIDEWVLETPDAEL